MEATNNNAVYYDDTVVRQFSIMAVVWGVVGMAVGVFIASQLAWPELNFGIPWLSYGRLRPLHTNAVIFAFGGSALFATSYYVVQRTCQTKLFMPKLASLTFLDPACGSGNFLTESYLSLRRLENDILRAFPQTLVTQ